MQGTSRRNLSDARKFQHSSIKKVYLSGKNKHLFVLVDKDDFEQISKMKWYLDTKGYAVNSKHTRMHRIINKTPRGLQTDHKNGNKLDNRRSNLRTATASENQYNRKTMSNNTSGHKGVSWSKVMKKWHVYINKDGVRHQLGFYSDKEEAIKVYKDAAVLLHKDFVRF